jgi:hypothetical protein
MASVYFTSVTSGGLAKIIDGAALREKLIIFEWNFNFTYVYRILVR